eukprot:TRINITY_DN64462_c0_g1_i1.p2 TRINITY_DN64462_c0_g1~~TRINITY_DN64462_c0_g1_i1.p2  ORF type:complete len:182 (-),score=42.46 TRINITY_DN64462_c0_g1_i1:304-849(-)
MEGRSTDAKPSQGASGRGRGRGRGATGRGYGGGTVGQEASTGKRAAPGQTPQRGATEESAAARSLTQNIQSMRFMQSAKEEEQRKQQEKEQLRHIAELQWVMPGFHQEVKKADAVREEATVSERIAPPVLRIYRRSYKNFNPVVEVAMKAQKKKHADAVQAAADLEQASALRTMKQRRVGA